MQELERPAIAQVLVGGREVHPRAQRPAVGEADAEHRILARRLHGEAVARARLDQALAQPRADARQPVVDAGLRQHVERRAACGRATGLPLSVLVAHTTSARGRERASSTAITSARPAIAAIGKPPLTALP